MQQISKSYYGFCFEPNLRCILLNTEMFASKAKIVEMMQRGYQILQYFRFNVLIFVRITYCQF